MGRLYSQTVASFWRAVRHKGIWLKPKHLMRWHSSEKLHAHTADACVQAFFASLKSWRVRKKLGDPDAHPPRKRYFRIEYKRSAMVLKEGKLRLSNGKGNEPLVLNWPWELPQTVVIHWTGNQYEAIATYAKEQPYGPFPPGAVAGVDLGEIHMAVAHDGEQTHITNGRLLRSKVQSRNKLQAKLNSRIDGRMKKGSRHRKKLIRSKKRQLKKIEQQIKDIEHKSTPQPENPSVVSWLCPPQAHLQGRTVVYVCCVAGRAGHARIASMCAARSRGACFGVPSVDGPTIVMGLARSTSGKSIWVTAQ